MIREKLPPQYTMMTLLKAFEGSAEVVFLDSSSEDHELGPYRILGFDPFIRLVYADEVVTVHREGTVSTLRESPLGVLQQLLEEFPARKVSDLPFSGGAMGYFSYDLKNHLERLPDKAVDDMRVPEMQFNFYHGALVEDRKNREIFYTDYDFDGRGGDRYKRLLERLASPSEAPFEPFRLTGALQSNFEKADYLKALSRVKEYIRQGDIYQANMTQRFAGRFAGNPLTLYERLRALNPAPFSAYARLGEIRILSSSPERLIEVRDSRITTRPIKGTVPRGGTPREDEAMIQTLKDSEKDHAELLMIVDLARNDLGRICKPGTVKVPELFKIESYATVHHLVATVTGELREGMGIREIIQGVFPGGSITGAPKIRAMAVIDELEPTRRNIYTGSLGYIDFNGDMDLNILIRTLLVKGDQVQFQVGGGIVWDSLEEAEYQETLHKGRALVKALEGVD